MMTLYLVRHGETDWNRGRRIQGHQDPTLNRAGRGQARSLAARFVSVAFDAAYASDLKRAWQTAEILMEGRRVSVSPCPELRERHLGRWEGHTVEDVAEAEPEAWRVWLDRPRDHAPHGGETEVELEQRAIAALSAIATAHPNGTVLAVSHGGTIHAVLNGWLGVDHHQSIPNCGVFVIAVDGEKRELESTLSIN